MRETFVGFDSAWADKEPGGVCFATLEGNRLVDYGCPEPAYFDHAKSVIERCSSHTQHYTLIAIDQPTMVPNWTGMRPVERVAGSVKQGVQPAYRGKESVFGPSAPIWTFLDSLQASEQPEEAQRASEGLHLIEVYPGLALSAFFDSKADDLPLSVHYNPAKQFTDWQRVAEAVAMQANRLRLAPFADWANSMSKESHPEKTDQDCLDALICLIVACKWRRQDPDMLVVGDWRGYMVTPLSLAANRRSCIGERRGTCQSVADRGMSTNPFWTISRGNTTTPLSGLGTLAPRSMASRPFSGPKTPSAHKTYWT